MTIWRANGRFSSICTNFSFNKFPFDEFECSFNFESEDWTEVVDYNVGNFDITEDVGVPFLGDTEIWEVVNIWYTTTITNPRYSTKIGYRDIRFSMKFKRKYNYYISNLFIPTFGIYYLQFFAFLLSPNGADRPTFGVTVVLTLLVVLSMIFDQIPKTSEVVYVVLLIGNKLIGSLVMTVYFLISAIFPDTKMPINFKNSVKFFKLSAVRMIDLLVAVIIFLYSVFSDAYFLYKMAK